MRKYVYMLLLQAFIGIAACSDALNLQDPNNVVEDAFYKSETEALSGLAGIYDAFQSTSLMGKKYREFDHISDNATTVQNTGGWLDFETSAQAPTSSLVNTVLWPAYYTVVSRANSVVEKVSAMTDAQLTEESRKRIVAEASFLRDYAYHDLTALWGAVPFYTTRILSSTTPAGPTEASEIRRWLIQNLHDEVIPYLPEAVENTENGRLRKGAAQALLGKLYLYEKAYADAASSFREVIDSKVYDLYADYSRLFSTQGEFSQENLFEINFSGSSVDAGESFSERIDTSAALVVPNQFWQPIASLVNSYLCLDGKPVAQSAWYGSPSPLFDAARPHQNRDPRLRAAIYTSDDVSSSGQPLWKFTGISSFAVKKYTTYSNEQFTNGGPQNYYVIRFADVLLSYAEARNEEVGPDASVYEAVNRIRARVGMPTYPEGLTADEMRTRIRDERRWEFAFEHQRFFDLQRWGITGTAVVEAFPDRKKYEEPKDLLWPYPQNEMDRNAALKEHGQNPGY